MLDFGTTIELLLSETLHFGLQINCFNFYWSSSDNEIYIKKSGVENFKYFLSILMPLTLRTTYLSYYIYCFLTKALSITSAGDVCICFFFSNMSLSGYWHTFYLKNREKFIIRFKYLRYQHQKIHELLHAALGEDEMNSDEYKNHHILKSVSLTNSSSILSAKLFYPALCLFGTFWNMAFFHIFNTGSFIYSLILAFGFSYVMMIEITGITLMLDTVTLGFFLTFYYQKIFLRIWSKDNLTYDLKWKLHLLWRNLEIYYNFAYDGAVIYFPIIFPLAELAIISCAYSAIALHKALGVGLSLTLVPIGYLAVYHLNISTQPANMVTNLSVEVKNLTKSELKWSKLDRMRFRSYRPFIWPVGFGGSLKITKMTLPTILQDIVLANVINLLLMTRNSA